MSKYIGNCENCNLTLTNSDCQIKEINGKYYKVVTCPRCKKEKHGDDRKEEEVDG